MRIAISVLANFELRGKGKDLGAVRSAVFTH
jgi:hypothetical protein